MSYSDIQHRFANKQEGKNGCVRSGNVRYEGRNYYSYNTVFGQWLDTEKNVCVYFDGSTTPSSTKHRLGRWLFPDDVHAFPYRDGRSSYYSYEGCLLVSWSEFNFEHRMTLLEHYVGRIYEQIAAINGGKKKGLEHVTFTPWGYIEELCSLYKDKVETSQNIRMPIEVAKKFFHIIKKWHENPSSFKEIMIDTKGSGKYTISSYENGILTAGCHKIAYTEMERMYNEIINA